jgi:hypothetical protein
VKNSNPTTLQYIDQVLLGSRLHIEGKWQLPPLYVPVVWAASAIGTEFCSLTLCHPPPQYWVYYYYYNISASWAHINMAPSIVKLIAKSALHLCIHKHNMDLE